MFKGEIKFRSKLTLNLSLLKKEKTLNMHVACLNFHISTEYLYLKSTLFFFAIKHVAICMTDTIDILIKIRLNT